MIEMGNVLIRAVRTSFIPNRSDNMKYRLPHGEIVVGRFRWTYP